MEKVVLIAEDDPKNMKLVQDLLQVKGYSTLEAKNGKQSVEIAKEKKPDLILMDIQMPVMDRIEATKVLKADDATKEIPILALTSFAMSGDEQRILEAGCDGYISKPIDTGGFMKKVEEYLS